MGTRSLTRVIPRQKGLSYQDGHKHPEKAVVNIYRQYDGYPDGLGLELAEFLSDFTIVDGFKLGDKSRIANGAGCLAAQLVAYLKDGPGNVYLEPITLHSKPGDMWEEYIYTIYPKEGEPTYISIYEVYGDEVIFVGTPKDLQSKYE